MRRYRRLSVVARALAQHALISLLALVLVGAAAAPICIQAVRGQALRQAETNGEAIAHRVVEPLITPALYAGDPKAINDLDLRVRLRKSGDSLLRVKVWSGDGLVVYSDEHREIGLTFPLDPADV